MMEQAGFFKASVCAVAVAFASTAYAQDNAQPAAGEPAQGAEQQAKPFYPLFRVMNVRGAVEVNNPDVGTFAPAVNNKAYPLGTIVRTGPGGSAFMAFSAEDNAQLLENTEAVGAAPRENPNARLVRLVSGKIKLTLRDNLPEGSFSVVTPSVSCKNLCGRGDYTLTTENNNETLLAATITGSATVQGLYYVIPALRAANTVSIQTATDHSMSRLTGVSGDYPIVLENGTEEPVTYTMSPKAVVKIWRENAPVGGRAIVSTLVISPTGRARHRFVYAEGRPNLATGELIVRLDEDDEEKNSLPVLLTTDAAKKPPAAAPHGAEPEAANP